MNKTSRYFTKDDVSKWWAPSRISLKIRDWILLQENWDGKNVLEIGCGNGHMLNQLRLKGASVVGVDLCKSMLISQDQNVILTDALSLPFLSCSFDVIVSVEVFCHIQHRNAFFSEIFRVLKPHGIVYMQAENSRGFHKLKLAFYDSYHLIKDGTKLMFNIKPEKFKKLVSAHHLTANHSEFFYHYTKFVVKCQKVLPK